MEKQTDQNTNNEKPTSTKKITMTNTEEIIPRLIPRPSSLCNKFSLMQRKQKLKQSFFPFTGDYKNHKNEKNEKNTYGILSLLFINEFKNLSEATVSDLMDASTRFATSGCCIAKSLSTSYGSSLAFPVSVSIWLIHCLYVSVGLVLMASDLSVSTSFTNGARISRRDV